jgi:hypothetical protein
LNYENFPRLSEIIGKSEWLYLPQEVLSSDPLEYNVNAEVFTLTGPVEQQDIEIAALYRDAQVNYGKKNVLGILATRNENIEHGIFKRDAPDPTDISSTTPSDETSMKPKSYEPVYLAKGKGLLYTEEVPVLRYNGMDHALAQQAFVAADERSDTFKLIINFRYGPTGVDKVTKLSLKTYKDQYKIY